jgi:esterase/lipase
MSKFIPNKEKKEDKYPGQIKPKLKIKINFQDGETTINEYDLAQMVSNMNSQLVQLSQAVKGITDAMARISNQTNVVQSSVDNNSEPGTPTIKLPKLNTVVDKPVNLQS